MASVIKGTRYTEGFNQSATTYDGANEKLDIADFVDTLRPTDTPLIMLVGKNSIKGGVHQVKHEWLEDAVAGLSTTTTDTDLNNTSTGVVTLTVAAGEGFKFLGYGTTAYDGTGPCDIVRITSTAGEELAIVLGSATTSIIVQRGYASWSTPVDHTGYTKTVTIVGSFQPQGLATVGTPRTTIKTPLYNYTQIFSESYQASATQQATEKWTQSDDYAYETGKIMENLGVKLERALLYGKKQAPTGGTVGSTMDGIRTRISTNLYNKSAAKLAQSHLEDAMVASWNVGGRPTHAIVNSTQKRVIGQMLDPYRQAGYSDTVLGTEVQRYETPFGNLTLVLDRHMPDDEVLILDIERIRFGALRELQRKLDQTSIEVDIYQWTTEVTCETKQESVHARIYGLATTGVL